MTDDDIIPDDLSEEKPSTKGLGNGERKPVGIKTVLASSAIAAALGMGGGAYFGGMAGPSTQPATIDYSADLETANKSISTLTAKLERFERQVSDLENQKPMSSADNLPDFSNIEDRLAALENTDDQLIDLSSLTGRIATLEQAAFEPKTLEGLSDIQARLDTLENAANKQSDDMSVERGGENSDMSLTELETRLSDRIDSLEAVEFPEIPKVNLKPIESRLDQLERQLNSIPVALPPFPREAVFDAIETAKLATEAGQKKSWLSRALGDQVVVQDADLVMRLDRIENNVARQDVNAIEQDIASLPEAAQDALNPWLTQIRKTGTRND